MKVSTRCVQLEIDDRFGAISTPIYQTATFRQPTATEWGEYDYSRTANPTRDQLEKKLARLENGRFATAFASGMAAITAVSRLLEAGDEIVAGDDLYGGSVRLLERILPRQGVNVRYVDATDLAAVAGACTERTKLILIETPTNPLMGICDIAGIAHVAHGRGALLAVDNTMLSPCLQNPLDLGADIVVHSATKFICGHSDVMAGAVVTNSEEIHRKLSFVQNAEGAALSPFDSWLLLRGIKTLSLRVERQSENAAEIARFLTTRPEIKKVYYPGLTTHPGHDVHSKQASGGGSVLSFTTGDVDLSKRLVESLRLCSIAVSFGSVNSSVSLPCFMSHASIPEPLRDRLAPPPDLIRLSIGIEDLEDIFEDIKRAFELTFNTLSEAAKLGG